PPPSPLSLHDALPIYLAYTPEPGQGTMSAQLTQLLQEVVRRWPGPLPRLAYVTDAGDNETTYYKKVLRRLRHPATGKRLEWFWVDRKSTRLNSSHVAI